MAAKSTCRAPSAKGEVDLVLTKKQMKERDQHSLNINRKILQQKHAQACCAGIRRSQSLCGFFGAAGWTETGW
eukprot:2104042-Rhodomonas_salina.2